MARLWTSGFELRSAVEWQSSDGTVPSISTSVVRSGGASLRCNPSGAVSSIAQTCLAAVGPTARVFLRMYFRVASLPAANTAIMGWSFNLTGSTGFVCIKLAPDGRLFVGGSSSTTPPSGVYRSAITINQWYRLEMDYDDNADVTRAYLDGVQWDEYTGIDLTGGNIARFGVMQSTTADIYIDDVAVNDSTGTVQNGLPGRGTILALRPNAAGDNNGFTTAVGGTAGAANNYTRVSEVTPDDATSYNSTVATGTTTIDDFNLEDPSTIPHGASIPVVSIGARIGSNAVTAASLVFRIKSQAAGTVVESASTSVAVNGWATNKIAAPFTSPLIAYVEPQASLPWTKELLNATQIGYRGDVSQTTARRVSALWLNVEYRTPLPTTTLSDNFNDNTVDTAIWVDNFGTVSETGGRGRISCDTGYNAYSSALAYQLKESSLTCRVYPAAADPSDGNAWIQMLVKADVGGTDVGIEVDSANNRVAFFSRTGYFDAGSVYVPYNPVKHTWVRIRETGGNTYFETSRDSVTWDTQRTITSPSWVGDANLECQFIAHKDAGTTSYAEIDNVNFPNTSILKVWDGTKWVSRSVKVWDGTAWVVRSIRPYDGTQWKVG